MSLYEVSGKVVLLPGPDGIYTRRGLEGNSKASVLCGGYCWTCDSFSPNPGCRRESDLRAAFECICPKFWNVLLKMGFIN